MKYEAVVIGVSSGGMSALRTLLPSIPSDFALATIIVQHVSANSEGEWIDLLNAMSHVTIKEAEEKEPINSPNVYVAPPNYHLLIERDKTFSFSTESKVNYARPSIDVLFETAAEAYGEGLIGVILTGSNHDGAEGLKKIKEQGGIAIVQDPDTAESRAMPDFAIQKTRPDHVLSLEDIPNLLIQLSRYN